MSRAVWALAGPGLLLLGAVLLLTSDGAESFGWFAYTPVSDGGVRFPDELVVLTSSQLLACLVGVLGLLVTVGGLAYRAGSRRRAPSPPG